MDFVLQQPAFFIGLDIVSPSLEGRVAASRRHRHRFCKDCACCIDARTLTCITLKSNKLFLFTGHRNNFVPSIWPLVHFVF